MEGIENGRAIDPSRVDGGKFENGRAIDQLNQLTSSFSKAVMYCSKLNIVNSSLSSKKLKN